MHSVQMTRGKTVRVNESMRSKARHTISETNQAQCICRGHPASNVNNKKITAGILALRSWLFAHAFPNHFSGGVRSK